MTPVEKVNMEIVLIRCKELLEKYLKQLKSKPKKLPLDYVEIIEIEISIERYKKLLSNIS